MNFARDCQTVHPNRCSSFTITLAARVSGSRDSPAKVLPVLGMCVGLNLCSEGVRQQGQSGQSSPSSGNVCWAESASVSSSRDSPAKALPVLGMCVGLNLCSEGVRQQGQSGQSSPSSGNVCWAESMQRGCQAAGTVRPKLSQLWECVLG
ncbi:hypothetical protein RRG08_019034 [Elysia crispata]|uniref:Uncharacterized protein n=1 Tax=Elysia crispata TaxID=231223 RepID=A0AAE1DTU5_9GAST|nr:hypothetical protein RRG08_019034 [Elysia crispata]